MATALMSRSQLDAFLGHVRASRSPFRYAPTKMATPTIDNHEYLTSRIIRRKALFKSIEKKVKPFKNPVYVAKATIITKSQATRPNQVLVRIVKQQVAPKPVQKQQPQQGHDIDEAKRASLLKAMAQNKWKPECPLPMKKNWYMDPRELFYRVARVQYCGGFAKAGYDGERLCELFGLLAKNYIGRICFKDPGQMSNMVDDLIQEATTKCVLVVGRFKVWDKKNPGQINNAFAYFTTVSRNKMFETLGSALAVSDVHLEDLSNESSNIGDLV